MSVRHFLLPLLICTHSKGGDPVVVALVNRKRGMPAKAKTWEGAKAKTWEGALGLFGGLAEPGEDRMATLRREVWADGDKSELPALPKDGEWGEHLVGSGGAYTVTPYRLAVPWTQDLYRTLAATCGEGVLDWIRAGGADWPPAHWIFPDMPNVVGSLLARAR